MGKLEVNLDGVGMAAAPATLADVPEIGVFVASIDGSAVRVWLRRNDWVIPFDNAARCCNAVTNGSALITHYQNVDALVTVTPAGGEQG